MEVLTYQEILLPAMKLELINKTDKVTELTVISDAKVRTNKSIL